MKTHPSTAAGILVMSALAGPWTLAAPGDGIRLGETVVHPYLTIGATYDDNVFRSSPDDARPPAAVAPEDVEADSVAIAATGAVPASEAQNIDAETPSDWRTNLELGLSALNRIAAGRGALSLDASVNQTSYQDFSAEDGRVYRLRLGIRYTTARDVSVSLSNDLRIRTGGDSTATTDRAESVGNRVAASVLWPVGAKTGLEFLVSDDRIDYDSDSLLGTEEIVLGINGHYRAFPRASTFIGYRHGWITRDEGTNITTRGDATFDEVDGGVAGILSPRLRGRAAIGYQRRTYDSVAPEPRQVSEEEIALLRSLGIAPPEDAGSDDETTAWIGSAGLSYSLQPRTTFDISASQSINESAYSANNEYLRSAINLGVSHRLPSRVYLQARAGYTLVDYQEDFLVFDPPPEGGDGPLTPRLEGRSDNQYTYGVRVGYPITDWSGASLSYTHFENTSDFPGAEYDYNLYTASLTVRY